jgi:hypothetical protein
MLALPAVHFALSSKLMVVVCPQSSPFPQLIAKTKPKASTHCSFPFCITPDTFSLKKDIAREVVPGNIWFFDRLGMKQKSAPKRIPCGIPFCGLLRYVPA